jgi:hypothetical protein
MPVVLGHLGHGPVDSDAGIVHQDVDPAMLVDHLMHHPPAVIRLTDVSLVHGDPPTWIVGGYVGQELLDGLIAVPVAGRHVRALVSQAAADGAADSPGAARDQGHPSLDLTRTRPLCLLLPVLLGPYSSHRVIPASCRAAGFLRPWHDIGPALADSPGEGADDPV